MNHSSNQIRNIELLITYLLYRFVGSKEEDEGEGEEKERGARAQSSGPPSISANMPASYSIDLNVHFSHARFVSLT